MVWMAAGRACRAVTLGHNSLPQPPLLWGLPRSRVRKCKDWEAGSREVEARRAGCVWAEPLEKDGDVRGLGFPSRAGKRES